MADRTVRIRLEAAIGGFQQGMRRASQETRQFGGQVGQTIRQNEQAFTRVGIAATAMGGAILLGMRKGRDAANELNAAMANVASLIPGATERVLELRGEVQTLAVDVGKGTSDIAGGLYQVVSAFGDTADTADILRINAEGARAGLASTTDAINLTSAVTKGYGDTTADAVQHAADLAYTTVRLGQTTFPELAGSLGRVVPLAAAMNVTQQELFGTMATFTGVTGDAARVSTQFESALAALQNPSDRLRVLMEELGFASGEAMIESMGFEGALKAIVAEAERSGVPLMEFLRRKEAITLALAGAGGQADTWTEKNAEMASVSGATAEALAEQTEGINKHGFTAEQAAVKMEVAWQNLGEAVAPTAGRMAEAVGNAAERFSNLDAETQQAVGSIGLLAGGFLTVGGATALLLPRLLLTIDAIRQLRRASMLARGLMGPWGAGIGGTAVVLWAFNQTLKDARQQARDFVAELEASGATAGETAAEIRERIAELQDQLDGWSTERFAQGMRASETPVRELRDEIEQLEAELDVLSGSFFEATGYSTSTALAMAQLAEQTSGVSDEMREAHPELAAAIDGLEGLEDGAEGTTSALEGLTDEQRRVAAAIAPSPYYPMEVAS